MHKSKRLTIEAVTVMTVMSILFIAIWPRFMDSQIRHKITQARSDLHTIAQAMKTYNIDYDDAIRWIEIENLPDPVIDGWSESFHSRVELKDEQTAAEIGGVTHTQRAKTLWLDSDRLLPYISHYPEPLLPVARENSQGGVEYGRSFWRHYKVVKNRSIQDKQHRYDTRPVSFILNKNILWSNTTPPYIYTRVNGTSADVFLSGKTNQYIGHSSGPLETTIVLSKRIECFYDPTNGMISHGFIIYESPEKHTLPQ